MRKRFLFLGMLLLTHLGLLGLAALLPSPWRTVGNAAAQLLPLLLLRYAPPGATLPPLLPKRPRRAAAIALPALPFFLLITCFAAWVSARLLPPSEGGSVSASMPFVTALALHALLPAVGEELFWRSAVLSLLRREGKGVAVLLSSILFALLHGAPARAPYALVAGGILALTVLLTESLLPAILYHFLNNALSLALLYGLREAHLWLSLAATALPAAIAALLLWRRGAYRALPPESEPKKEMP